MPDDRDVWRIAAPMILSNVTVPLLGMVDTFVMGHLDGPQYLGGVAVGSIVFSFLYTGMNFLRMGTTGITAQSYGANDNDGLRSALGQSLIVATLLALTLVILKEPISTTLAIVGAEPAVESLAYKYFDIRIFSAPGTLANMALIGWFIGLSNARVPMLMFLTTTISNMILDLVFVFGMGMDVDGVALASVIAEFLGLAVGLVCASRALAGRDGQWPVARLTKLREYAVFFSVNANIFVRTMALMFSIAFVTAQSARFGQTILAANAILMQLQNLTSFGLDGIAHAAEALVGKTIGQKNRAALERAVKLSLKWSLYFAAAYAALYAVGGPLLIGVLTDIEDVRSTTVRYLPWLVVSPLVSVWSFLYDGVFVGATRAKDMRNVMLISTFVVFLPAWYLLQGLGNDGLWLAFMLFLASRGIGMHALYGRRVLPSVRT